MNKVKTVLCLSALGLMFISCEKQQEDNLVDPNEASKTFTVGDYSQVNVISNLSGDPLFSFSGISNDIEETLDVDNDGTDDFRFHYQPYHNLSGGQKVSITLECLNPNMEVAANVYSDSSKICYAQTANHDSVFFNTTGSFNCQASSAAGWIPDYGSTSSYLSPDVSAAGDQPTAQITWHGKTLLLKSEDKTSDMQTRALYQIEKGQWVRAQNEYILFRHQVNGSTRYGWMQLSSENLFDFVVREVATEKS